MEMQEQRPMTQAQLYQAKRQHIRNHSQYQQERKQAGQQQRGQRGQQKG